LNSLLLAYPTLPDYFKTKDREKSLEGM